jgi:hypothetical protein
MGCIHAKSSVVSSGSNTLQEPLNNNDDYSNTFNTLHENCVLAQQKIVVLTDEKCHLESIENEALKAQQEAKIAFDKAIREKEILVFSYVNNHSFRMILNPKL